MKLLITKLAKFHAATAVIQTSDKEIFKSHNIPLIDENVKTFHDMFKNILQDTSDITSYFEGYERIGEKLLQLKDSFVKKGRRIYDVDENAFNVLNHGDLWANNVMYKYDENDEAIDVLMVDFQIGYWGSPGLDLTYLLFSSSADDIFEREWDQLLRIYHDELISTLKKLNFSKPLPSFTYLKMELLNRALLGVIFGILINAIRQLKDEDRAMAEAKNFIVDTKEAVLFRQSSYSSEKFRNRAKYLLDYFDRQGFLDSLE